MKEEYQNYRKSIKKKYAWGFWNNPAYEEEMTVSVKPKVAIFLFAKVLEELEWGIRSLQDESLEGVHWTKKQVVLQKISIVCVDPLTIRLRSESEEKNMTDGGANYRNIKLILYVYHKLTKDYTPEQYEAIEKEIDRRNNWENYEVPETLPAPYVYREPDKQKFFIGFAIGLLPLVCSSFLFPVYSKEFYLPFAFEMIWSFVIQYLLFPFVSLEPLLRRQNYSQIYLQVYDSSIFAIPWRRVYHNLYT